MRVPSVARMLPAGVEQRMARIVRPRGDSRGGDDLDVDLADRQHGEQQHEEAGQIPYGAIGHASRKTVRLPCVRTTMCGRPPSAARSALTTAAATDSATAPTVSTASTRRSASSGSATYAHAGSVAKWRSS